MRAPAGSGRSGFTLLELLISLFIIALILGMAMLAVRNSMADENIREAARKIQIFAKTARNRAVESGQAHEILLRPKLWELRAIVKDEESGEESWETFFEYHVPESLRWQIKPWGSSKWETPKEMAWTFQPSGLCAPQRFRLEYRNSWMEFSFNPLTANPQDEAFYLP